jgi:hypothetical protein
VLNDTQQKESFFAEYLLDWHSAKKAPVDLHGSLYAESYKLRLGKGSISRSFC